MAEYPKESEKEESLRNSGIESATPDKAKSAEARQEKLNRDPPPLVHVDPSTGKPIDRPLDKGAEANVNTLPGADPGGPQVAGNRKP